MVLYRKYRPQTIEDLDSAAVRERLRTVLSSEYIPHAFLFSGSKGSGKTSSARILAKWFNCEKKSTVSSLPAQAGKQLAESKKTENRLPPTADNVPCNVCDSCVAITAGSYLDVIEIDAASNRGIDEMRQLRENISLAPVAGKMKVYIIDEVHMLTNEAFNALLKTVEEPPEHAVFILATTEPDKVPETIRSRATHIMFPKADAAEIRHALHRVLMGEKATVSDAILDRIAQSADGSFRDATKLLEQVLSEGISDISGAERILGTRTAEIGTFYTLLAKKDTTALLYLVETMKHNGADMKGVITQLLEHAHQLLLAQHNVSGTNRPEESFPPAGIAPLLKVLSRVYSETKTAGSPEIPLEIAIVEWCESSR